MIKLEINGIPVEVPQGTSILNAAKVVHVKIPSLCYHPDLKAGASCGICVVRNAGSPKLLRACCTEVAPGMKITTHDSDIVDVRRTVLELILANHPNDCLQCPRSGNCELQKIAADFGIREVPFPREVLKIPVDDSTPSLVLNQEKCIKCGMCELYCPEFCISEHGDGFFRPDYDYCKGCGICVSECPCGAIKMIPEAI